MNIGASKMKPATMVVVVLVILLFPVTVIAVNMLEARDEAKSAQQLLERRQERLDRENAPPAPTPTREPLPFSESWGEPVFFADNMLAVFNRAELPSYRDEIEYSADGSLAKVCGVETRICEPPQIGIICIEDEIHGIYWGGGYKLIDSYSKPRINV